MNKHWTEDAIRAFLDGTFTRVHYDGHTTTEIVPADFIPPFAGGEKRKTRGKDIQPRAVWTAMEAELLWQMRIRNRPIAEIAWTLNRTEESVAKRLQIMRCEKGMVV